MRLIGVGISGWAERDTAQADLFETAEQKVQDQKILEAIDTVEEKFGRRILQVGMSRDPKAR